MDEEIAKKISNFFKKNKFQKYRKGEILIRADDNPSGIFYLTKGMVREYAITKSGEEVVVNIFKPFAFFPVSYAMNGTSNAYFFEAVTDLELWKAPIDDTLKFLKDNPDVTYDLLRRVYKGTDGILKRMTYLMAGDAHSRLIVELIIHAERFSKGSNSVELQLTETDLASQTGMARETISRQFRILKDKGLVAVNNNKIQVPDLNLLKSELES